MLMELSAEEVPREPGKLGQKTGSNEVEPIALKTASFPLDVQRLVNGVHHKGKH